MSHDAMLVLGLSLLAVPFAAHFVIDCRWFGWRSTVGFYVCLACFIGGIVVLSRLRG